MSSTFTKDPAAVLDYAEDWTQWLGDDTITGVVWTVPDGITKASSNFTQTVATIWLAGGTVDTTYLVVCAITTAAGRTDERTLRIQVRDR